MSMANVQAELEKSRQTTARLLDSLASQMYRSRNQSSGSLKQPAVAALTAAAAGYLLGLVFISKR